VKEEKTSKRREAVDMVREKSKAGRLVSTEELLLTVEAQDAAKPEAAEAPARAESWLIDMMEKNKDLKAICAKSGASFCYSSLFMSEPYARILLRKKEGAADLIANTVREDSDRYPRPTPLDIFKEAPFDLNQEELFSCLEGMSNREEFQDIGQVSTSMGHVFLYSSRYLDRDYALMLAEWIDVGQFENP
jgi:hypothetical protein